MDLDLPLGDPGLSLSDIEPRLYSGTSRVALGSPVLTDLDGIDYLLAGVPDGPGELTLTYVHPPGAGFARKWGTPYSLTPQAIIIPLRESSSASLSVQILKNGAPWTGGVPALTYLGTLSEPGDWAVSGWPDAKPGERWVLRYSIGDVHGQERWAVPALPDLDLDDWELADYAYVASILPESWVPDIPVQATWRTIVASGQAIVPPPIATPFPGPPTLFAVWDLTYGAPRGDLSDDLAPLRPGRLTVAGYLQEGARPGPLRLLRKAVRRALRAAPPGTLEFQTQLAVPVRVGARVSGFWQENLVVPFWGNLSLPAHG